MMKRKNRTNIKQHQPLHMDHTLLMESAFCENHCRLDDIVQTRGAPQGWAELEATSAEWRKSILFGSDIQPAGERRLRDLTSILADLVLPGSLPDGAVSPQRELYSRTPSPRASRPSSPATSLRVCRPWSSAAPPHAVFGNPYMETAPAIPVTHRKVTSVSPRLTKPRSIPEPTPIEHTVGLRPLKDKEQAKLMQRLYTDHWAKLEGKARRARETAEREREAKLKDEHKPRLLLYGKTQQEAVVHRLHTKYLKHKEQKRSGEEKRAEEVYHERKKKGQRPAAYLQALADRLYTDEKAKLRRERLLHRYLHMLVDQEAKLPSKLTQEALIILEQRLGENEKERKRKEAERLKLKYGASPLKQVSPKSPEELRNLVDRLAQAK
eukprot:TRINITY_DN5347_c0_g1_i2.p1 TRINITY_DN5347_c0_g1~~TRINITY_DN5347_c0_g1_i2.p1  ORF type:complete len:381 (-),score=68.58 TRINITY_DN5347_c0_g1_i2:15-1157(-)